MTLPCNEPRNLMRRVERARDWPVNTCPASRALVVWAKVILRDGDFSAVEGDAEEVAAAMLSVVESLWKLRRKMAALEPQREVA